jgi:hypothetical protein
MPRTPRPASSRPAASRQHHTAASASEAGEASHATDTTDTSHTADVTKAPDTSHATDTSHAADVSHPTDTGAADNGALTLAAVTAVLKDVLSNGLVEHGVPAALGDVPVTAMPPDRIPIGEEERSQLNVYLFRVTPNTAWRTVERSNGRVLRPPPTVDLHYLLTAYGAQDLQSEILLGAAVELMHARPIVDRETLHATMAAGSSAALSSPTRAALAAAAPSFSAIERLEITPQYLNTEEMTKLWSALQAHFRVSVAYKVTVVPTGRRADSSP